MARVSQGLCGCGCGRATSLAKKTRKGRGQIKGEPIAYIHGHNTRKYAPGYEEQDTGYETPCWIWTGRLDTNGYPMNGKHAAHREMYEAENGSIAGLHLHHLCETPACVRPSHCTPVTKGKHRSIHNTKVLTPALVEEIRRATGTQRSIAARLGIGKTTVARVQHRVSWLDH